MTKPIRRLWLQPLESRTTPALFVVTNTDDSGPGSLRQAVLDANFLAGEDTIQFASPLFDTAQTIVLTTGELAITDDLIVNGPGADKLTISGNKASRIFNINIAVGNDEVTLSGLTLANGSSTGSGGAIFFQNEAVTIVDSVLTGNKSDASGGAVSNNANGNLTVLNTSVTGNTAKSNGGGVYFNFGGTLQMENSVVSNNTSGKRGGGLYNFSGTFNISNTVISNNTSATRGGGITVQNTLGILNLDSTTVSGNKSGQNGGGIYFFFRGELSIANSTISGNQSNTTSPGPYGNRAGGGVYTYATVVSVVNSTISGNLVNGVGAGGGFYATGGTVNGTKATINNTTIVNNTSSYGAGLVGVGKATAVTVASSIIADNTATLAFAPDVFGNVTASFSLVGDTADWANAGAGNDNLLNVNPLLGPLANNGGPTQTHALLAGSPAINAGSNPLALAFDQRGMPFPRTVGGQTDIGAFEFSPPPIVSGPFTVFVNEGSTGQFQATANQAVTFALAAGSPSWASIDPATGVVTLMPTDGPNDSTTLTVEATNPGGGTGTKNVNVIVRNVNPVISKIGSFKLGANTPLNFNGNFFDPGDDTFVGEVNYGDGSGWQPLSITGQTFDLNHVYAKAGNFTGQVRIADDDMAPGTWSFATFGVSVTGQLLDVDIDDGTDDPAGNFPNQGSAIRRITLDFNGIVNLPAGKTSYPNSNITTVAGATAATLTRTDGKAFTVNVLHTVEGGDSSRLVLTFSGGSGAAAVQGGSLADGKYALSIFGENFNVDDGVPFGPLVVNFTRMFGDANGDGRVDAADRALFLASYRTAVGNPNYRAYFDFDNDGVIAAGDYYAFLQRFGRML